MDNWRSALRSQQCDMDEKRVRDIMGGRHRGVTSSLLRAGAWAMSNPYGLLMRIRRGLYRLGLLPALKAGAAVISVGNLTTGGTGKTPMVAWVVGRLREMGREPAILTRGYKPAAGKSDEAELLWQMTGAPVVVNPDRVEGARAAVEAGADVLVLDDGFQHLRLARDLDIVLVDATNPFGYDHCLPRGLLREPPSALRDADAVVITRCDLVSEEQLGQLRRRLGRLARRGAGGADPPICLAAHLATGVADAVGRRFPPSALAGKKVCAFCGIGNPEGFFVTVARAGAVLAGKIALDDHAVYDPPALQRVSQVARDCQAEVLLTTAKDRVKIDRPGDLPLPLWTLLVSVGIVEGEKLLMNGLRAALGQKAPEA
jgi:tetraacyldisaccharide 4'-kinase